MEKIKIYFEDGQMKIRVPDETSLGRYKFLHECSLIPKDWTEEKNVLYVYSDTWWLETIQIAKYDSNKDSVEIAQDVENYYQRRVKEIREKKERQYRLENLKTDIERADTKQKYGCGCCEYLEYVKAHWEDAGDGEWRFVSGKHLCHYVNNACRYRWSDIEYEFEIYKEVKAFGAPIDPTVKAWIAPPYPCAGCMYIEKAEKAWEEINKEKEKDV